LPAPPAANSARRGKIGRLLLISHRYRKIARSSESVLCQPCQQKLTVQERGRMNGERKSSGDALDTKKTNTVVIHIRAMICRKLEIMSLRTSRNLDLKKIA
jgi:hypothetical protein